MEHTTSGQKSEVSGAMERATFEEWRDQSPPEVSPHTDSEALIDYRPAGSQSPSLMALARLSLPLWVTRPQTDSAKTETLYTSCASPVEAKIVGRLLCLAMRSVDQT